MVMKNMEKLTHILQVQLYVWSECEVQTEGFTHVCNSENVGWIGEEKKKT